MELESFVRNKLINKQPLRSRYAITKKWNKMPVMNSTNGLYLRLKLALSLSTSSFKLLDGNLCSVRKNSFMNITKPALSNEVGVGEVICCLSQILIREHVFWASGTLIPLLKIVTIIYKKIVSSNQIPYKLIESRNQESRIQEPRNKNHESRIRNQESGIKNQESRIKKKETRTKNQKTRTKDQQSRNKNQHSRNKNQKSKNKNQESTFKNQESRNKNQHSRIKKQETRIKIRE